MRLHVTHLPNIEFQLFGGTRSPCSLVLGDCQMYQSLFGLSKEDRDSSNQACCVLVSLGAVTRRLYLIRGVVDDQIHYELHAELVHLTRQHGTIHRSKTPTSSFSSSQSCSVP